MAPVKKEEVDEFDDSASLDEDTKTEVNDSVGLTKETNTPTTPKKRGAKTAPKGRADHTALAFELAMAMEKGVKVRYLTFYIPSRTTTK